MANLNACNALGEKLAKASTRLEDLLAGGWESTDFVVMQLRKQVKVLAADYLAALAEPVSIKPWSPWNDGAAR